MIGAEMHVTVNGKPGLALADESRQIDRWSAGHGTDTTGAATIGITTPIVEES